ncbi:hypothetical protein EJ08DRAFT_112651 [Tothia fuscella]|uniref:Uncharacterized protein n=1 Tax=Tothia fuscella TaxID=1048955 RepID=A0A9P4NUY6_9PEZI|nr:hypothetical protein EJ08DRAFT_112651 [Tothia fuscella]
MGCSSSKQSLDEDNRRVVRPATPGPPTDGADSSAFSTPTPPIRQRQHNDGLPQPTKVPVPARNLDANGIRFSDPFVAFHTNKSPNYSTHSPSISPSFNLHENSPTIRTVSASTHGSHHRLDIGEPYGAVHTGSGWPMRDENTHNSSIAEGQQNNHVGSVNGGHGEGQSLGGIAVKHQAGGQPGDHFSEINGGGGGR